MMDIGDPVRLGDQGPILTVTHVSDDGPGGKHATVAWYDPKRGFVYETLPVAALKPVERRKVERNFVDSVLVAELQEKMRREAERAFGAGFMKPIPVLLPTEQRIRGLEMELADANDQLKAYKFQLEHLDKLRAEVSAQRSRADAYAEQVNVAGALGVRWTREGGVCKAHLDQSDLRDQLQLLADFHNKVAKLVNG